MLCFWNQHALYGCNWRNKVKLMWLFFCLCHLGNKTFSHTASSEKKWPKGNSPTGTFKDYLPPLRYLAGFSPTLFSQIKLKWPVSISVLFFTLIWDFLNFFTISCYLQNAENALFSSLHLCKMRLQNRRVWPVSVSAVSCSFGASGLNSSCFQHSSQGWRTYKSLSILREVSENQPNTILPVPPLQKRQN